MASVGIRSLDVGGQPEGYAGDVYHYPLMRILIAARARGLQAIDGPFLKVRDIDGFRRSAASAAALGYDGKWVLHPGQVDVGNETFTPSQADFDRASEIIEAYAHATDVAGRGAVMLGDEMLDEASRKMAGSVVAKGQASGLTRSAATSLFAPFLPDLHYHLSCSSPSAPQSLSSPSATSAAQPRPPPAPRNPDRCVRRRAELPRRRAAPERCGTPV